jgi:glycosyltransferase involved in cell wall biosynthesis
MVRVLALAPYPTGRVPGQRYRIEQWAPRLRELGIEVEFSPFLPPAAMDLLYGAGHTWSKVRATVGGHWRRLLERREWTRYDVAFIYREAALLGPPWVEKLIARKLPLVFDFDDPIYLPSSSTANAWASALKWPLKVATICRLARHVTVGNDVLAEWARPRSTAVTVVPSTIDTDLYRLSTRRPNLKPVVGWTGSTTTVPYLYALVPVLQQLRQEIDYELRVISDGEFKIDGVDVRCVAWRAETEVEDLRPLDIGLMPLPDDEWARGKCGMKALQYMALGIPPVVSPVGANAVIVGDGVSGYHARASGEWVERILELLRDPQKRAAFGLAGRRTVEERYSCRMHARRMGAVLRAAAGRSRPTESADEESKEAPPASCAALPAS